MYIFGATVHGMLHQPFSSVPLWRNFAQMTGGGVRHERRHAEGVTLRFRDLFSSWQDMLRARGTAGGACASTCVAGDFGADTVVAGGEGFSTWSAACSTADASRVKASDDDWLESAALPPPALSRTGVCERGAQPAVSRSKLAAALASSLQASWRERATRWLRRWRRLATLRNRLIQSLEHHG